jgi:hypothetical protein
MVGTKCQLTKPEDVIFVNKTGCNTNQKTDGHIGGELFVLPTGAPDSCAKGSCTDINFSVLCFNNALGVAVICAIILKSMKGINQLLVNVRLGFGQDQ